MFIWPETHHYLDKTQRRYLTINPEITLGELVCVHYVTIGNPDDSIINTATISLILHFREIPPKYQEISAEEQPKFISIKGLSHLDDKLQEFLLDLIQEQVDGKIDGCPSMNSTHKTKLETLIKSIAERKRKHLQPSYNRKTFAGFARFSQADLKSLLETAEKAREDWPFRMRCGIFVATTLPDSSHDVY